MDIDELMERAVVSGDEDLFEMIEMCDRVTVIPDDLGDEWLITFYDRDDAARYATIPMKVDGDEVVDWLVEQGVPRGRVRLHD